MDNLKLVFVISCVVFLGVTSSFGEQISGATDPPNKAELEQRIKNLNIAISNITADVKRLNQNTTQNFAASKDNAVRQYKALIDAISEMDNSLKNFTHKGCNDTEQYFKNNASRINATFDDYEKKCVELINNITEKLTGYNKAIKDISDTLASCTKDGKDDNACLTKVETQLNNYTDLPKNLENDFKILNQTILKSERNATVVADAINSEGLTARQCLKNLISAKHDIQVNLNDFANKIQAAKENLTNQTANIELYFRNISLSFEKNLNASLNEVEKIVNFTEAKHLNSTNCTDNIQLNKTRMVESFQSVLNAAKSTIDKQITEASSNIANMSQYDKYYNEQMKKLSECADNDCFEKLANDTSIETNSINKNITKYIESTQAVIISQQKNITEHKKDGEGEFSNITTKSYNCLMQVLKQDASPKIETLGIALNQSLENSINNLTNLSTQMNTFCDKIKLTFNNTIYHKLLNVTTEIETKESKANNMKLNIKTCTDEQNELNKYVVGTIQNFTTNVNHSRTNASDTTEKAIKDIGAFKSFTQEFFEELSACSVYDCIDEVVKKSNTTEIDDETATNLIMKQVNSTLEDIKQKLNSDQKDSLNRTLTEIDRMKNKVISCLDDKIKSFSTRSTPSFILICVLFLLQLFRCIH